MNKTNLMAVLLVLLLLALPAQGRQRRRHKVKHHPQNTTTRVATGLWGGAHVRLQVNDNGAEIEYDCAHGALTQPLTLDTQGRFSSTGTHAREHGGPIRVDEKPTSRPALYTGSVQGRTMTLTVTLTNEQQTVGTFALTQGSDGRLWKCR